MPTIHIYHHGDLDGKTAGACIYHMMNIPDFDDKICYNLYNYTIPLDFTNVKKDDVIFLVDYSLSNKDNIKRLAGLCKDYWEGEEDDHVFWLDHHKTSLSNIDTYPLNKISKVIDTDRCGAAISYTLATMCKGTLPHTVYKGDYSINSIKENINKINDNGINHFYFNNVNMFIDRVDDWDRWKLEYSDQSAFNLGATALYNDPRSDAFKGIAHSIFDDVPERGVDECLEYGKIVEKYISVNDNEKLSEMGFECNLVYDDTQYKCICYNGRGNSKTFGHLIDDFDICIMFYYTGDQFIYSLYSKEVDTSKISLAMGGGGHPGASGFQNKKLLFKKDSTTHIPNDLDL